MVKRASFEIVILRILGALLDLEIVQIEEHHALALRQLASIHIFYVLLYSLASFSLVALLFLMQA